MKNFSLLLNIKSNMKLLLITLIIFSMLLVACSDYSDNTRTVVKENLGKDSGSGTTSVDSEQTSGQTNTEKVCYGYISKDKLDSILKADMYANDYSSGLGECDYKKRDTTDDNVLKGTQVRISKHEGRGWYDKQKAFFTSENNIYHIDGIGDEAFGKDYSTIYFLKDGNTWFVNIFTGDENLVPELTIFNKEYNDVNKKNYEDHVKVIVKEIAKAVDGE